MPKNKKKVNAAILIIGNEILSGRTRDSNVSFISKWLNKNCGIMVEEVRVIPDLEKKIVKNILELKKSFKYVFTTGGIGPTHDDITAKSISKALKVKYEYNKKAFFILENYYGKKNFNDGRKKMAKMPRYSKLVYNPVSAAPGFIIKNIISLPGVPSILQAMMHNVKKYLIKGTPTISKTLNLYTVESNISKELSKIQNKYKKDIEIGSYPFFRLGKIGVSVVLRGLKKKKLDRCFSEIKKISSLKKIKIFKK